MGQQTLEQSLYHQDSAHLTMTRGSPSSPPLNPSDVDALLAKELNAMSIVERERLYEELHGVNQDIEEAEEFVQDKLAEFEQSVQRLVAQGRAAVYEQAFLQNSTYVLDPKFRLMFLRAEYFQPMNAVLRMVCFLDRKRKYFGDAALVRPIHLRDMDDNDMECLKTGFIQTLPTRDTRGRAVIADLNVKGSIHFKTIDNVIKSFLYIMYAAAEDEETQRRGVVAVFYYSLALRMAQELHKRESNILECIPLKMVGIHFCTQPHVPTMQVVKALMMMVFGRNNRVKVRIHEGSHTEVQYGLMSFGIPVQALPVTYEEGLKTMSHSKWISRRQKKDKAYFEEVGSGGLDRIEYVFNGVELPGPRDVLLGRGKTIQEHYGNQYLRSVAVVAYMEQYKTAAKNDKNNVAMEVVKDTKNVGGRFLKRSNSGGGDNSGNYGWWKEVDDKEALDRVCKAFRATISAIGKESTREVRNRSGDLTKSEAQEGKRLKVDGGMNESSVLSTPKSSATTRCCF